MLSTEWSSRFPCTIPFQKVPIVVSPIFTCVLLFTVELFCFPLYSIVFLLVGNLTDPRHGEYIGWDDRPKCIRDDKEISTIYRIPVVLATCVVVCMIECWENHVCVWGSVLFYPLKLLALGLGPIMPCAFSWLYFAAPEMMSWSVWEGNKKQNKKVKEEKRWSWWFVPHYKYTHTHTHTAFYSSF